ncbi:MAG: VWA-like domain-containing protein [Actinomycetota bacterium]|nr:VWA-like domain-containing protein [Actinomycetota bacterium]
MTNGAGGPPWPAEVAGPSPGLRRLQSGRARAATIAPYLAAALFALLPHESTAVPTMAVSTSYDLYWSPEFVDHLDVEQCAAVWLHEVSHLLRGHARRGTAIGVTRETARLWNLACDAAINADLRDMGLSLPGGVLAEDLGVHHHLSAEEIYALISSTERPAPPEALHPDCGSGAGGGPRAWEAQLSPDGGRALVDDAVARRVAVAIVEHVARDNGSDRPSDPTQRDGVWPAAVPIAWRLWAAEVLDSRIDWKVQLAKLTRRELVARGAADYTSRRLARREVEPFVLSSLAARSSASCAVVVDTSASIDEVELGAAICELAALVRALRGLPIDVVLCDTAATVVRRVVDPRSLVLCGGGGTDLRVGIAAAALLRPAADLIVVLTDGYTPWPSEPPPANRRARYLAVLLDDAPVPPPYFTTISVPGGGFARRSSNMVGVLRPTGER